MDSEGRVPNPFPLQLHQIIINSIPNFNNDGGCDPVLEISQNGKLVYSSIFADDTQSVPAIFQDAYNIIFSLSSSTLILGKDIHIRVSHRPDPDQSRTVSMMSFALNSGFMTAGIVRIAPGDMELPHRDEVSHKLGGVSRFEADFSMDLVLTENKEDIDDGINYDTFLDKSLAKGMAKLTQHHFLDSNPVLLKVLEGQGYKKVIG